MRSHQFLIYALDIMYSKLSIVCGLYFWLTIVSAAVNLAQIVSSNEDLQEQSTNADTDVNDVTMLNGLENAPVRLASHAYTYDGLTTAV